MRINFIKSSKKKEILVKLEEQFGISDLPYLLIESGKEKIRGFSGHLSKEEINEISLILNIEIMGLYLLKQEQDLRLSLDATTLLKEQITKNIIDISDAQLQEWLRGRDLDIKTPKGTIIIKNKDDLIGCGKSNGEKIFNYLPKDRRLKNKIN